MNYALENGMIDEAYIQAQINMKKRKELLEKHKHKIWQGRDGKWYTYIDDIDSGERILKKRSKEEALIDFICEHIQAEELDPTVQDVFNEWNNRRLHLGKIVESSYMRYLKIFERHYQEFGTLKIKKICPEDVIEFLEEQIPKYQLTAKGFSNLKTITVGMFKRAKRRGLIGWNVEEVLYNLDVSDHDFNKIIKEDRFEVYNDDERLKVMRYLEDNQDPVNIGLILLFVSGMRVGELAALRTVDIQDDNLVRVRQTQTSYLDDNHKWHVKVKDYPKTGAGIRDIVIPDQYRWVIKAARRINPFGTYVFEKNGERMTVRAFTSRLEIVCRRLGVPYKSPHKIRKTYGSILLDNGIDARFIIDQMGHTDVSTTEKCYHRNRKNVDRKRAILTGLEDFQTATAANLMVNR